MADQILITLDDLETAVPLNAALEAAGFATEMVSALDDARGAVRREHPTLVVLTGALHEPPARAAGRRYARDREVSTLALLEPTDSERGGAGRRGSASPRVMTKPVAARRGGGDGAAADRAAPAAAAHRHHRRERARSRKCWSRSSRWRRSRAPC